MPGAYTCTGLGPFGYPRFPGPPCSHAARYYVWPKCEPQITGYAYLCAEHLEELKRLDRVYQVTEIATGRILIQAGVAVLP
jgi:hypothetical protein